MINNKKIEKVLIFILFFTFLAPICFSDEEKSVDPVLDFYTKRAKAVYKSYHPDEIGAKYSFKAMSYLSEFKRDGVIELIDSSIVKYYFSFGNLDSHVVEISTTGKLDSLDFSYPNLFEKDYDFNFFPHDIGGENISIGVDSDTVKNLEPVGIAVLDRNKYVLRELYLYYPDEDRFNRYSVNMSFIEQNGIIFPDTINTTYSKAGIFSTAHYRLLTVFDSLIVIR